MICKNPDTKWDILFHCNYTYVGSPRFDVCVTCSEINVDISQVKKEALILLEGTEISVEGLT